ncbi:MAG: hypothetical protein KAZ36_05390, partial [Bacteroidales bacterium]|nr:hypothetical protein [Bacteroidales bacterium]
LLPLFYHGQHSGTVFLSDHNFLPAKVGTIMPEKKMLVAVGIRPIRRIDISNLPACDSLTGLCRWLK